MEDLRAAIPGALETNEFHARRQAIEQDLRERGEKDLQSLRAKAGEKRVAIVHTPMGFALAPIKNGEVLDPDEFAKLPEEERKRYEQDIEALGGELRARIEEIPRIEQDVRRKVKALVRETLMAAVGHLLEDAKKKYEAHPPVAAHLDALGQDVLENVGEFMKPDESPRALFGSRPPTELDAFRRYDVNVVVDRSGATGAPVVYEDHPTFENLLGRIEHISTLGTLVTDHNLVKAGALARANGGYLVLDARRVLQQPYAYEGLKRALAAKLVRIESLGQALGILSTVSLSPEPVALDVKVVLIGDRRLFYLLEELDPDFPELFKVVADFEDSVDRTEESERAYARLVAGIVKDEKLLPLDARAVARVLEQAARETEDSTKLTAHMGTMIDLLREADHFARAAGQKAVRAEDVAEAVRAKDRRLSRIEERMHEQIREGTVLIQTEGATVGQINGLSVITLGRHAFGRPSRITARVRLGKGDIVDLEREVELGGPIHSKGVLILSGFLMSRYALEHPLSLSATLTFEQSYGMVEGDSASSAELYALLSALADVPIRQGFAVTGSVNQLGEVQAIGGVNEKVEGFFRLCKARGLDGSHGVIVPASNARHVMLDDEVLDAVRDEKFHVHVVSTIDEGIELLTGVAAGARDAAGAFPEGSVNRKVEDRLVALATRRLELGKDGK